MILICQRTACYLILLTAFALNALASIAFAQPATDAPKPNKPNVVLILIDDLGWQDVKCYDVDESSPMDTPHLDAFAKQSVMFWQAYSPAPTCSPTRCAIISGNHPARAQKTHVVGGQPPHARNARSRMMEPWYSGRMPADTMTLARAMKTNGYTTGHVGKWHIAINHNAFPQPKDVGFDFTRSDRGAHSARGMKDRLQGFATDGKDDPYRLDANGFPFHQNSADALQFIDDNADKPFFLYYCTWLVHSPIFTRNEALLSKYEKRLSVDRAGKFPRDVTGQVNPFYCAMVESLDYYVGQMFSHLEKTEDPRWPGHMLSENTYVIFTSDNGGMEGGPSERYTDNVPLDRGKVSAKEGGTRVPLMIAGPGITKGIQSNVMINGLDFYPTILGLTGTKKPEGKNLDGCDLSGLLHNDPTNPQLVKHADGSVRDTMMWHFPNSIALESTLRTLDYKLIRNYDHVNNPETPKLELFRLYETIDGQQKRVDIEEAVNLAAKMPEKTAEMNRQLTEMLTEMKASYPYYNPKHKARLEPIPGQDSVCTVKSNNVNGDTVECIFSENGAKVIQADLIYTLNGNEKYEEWFRVPANLSDGTTASVKLPTGTTHYYFNLVDENRFLVSHPEVKKSDKGFANSALQAK